MILGTQKKFPKLFEHIHIFYADWYKYTIRKYEDLILKLHSCSVPQASRQEIFICDNHRSKTLYLSLMPHHTSV